MKPFLTTLLSLFLIGGLYAQDEPVNDTVYMTVNGDYGAFRIVLFQLPSKWSLYVDWGDGMIDYERDMSWPDYIEMAPQHSYDEPGEYQIKLFSESGDLKSKLFHLGLRQREFTSLNVSGCSALDTLNCESKQLTSLDASGCTALQYLNCGSNQLASLDVSGCTALQYLNCGSNQLTSLDASGCTALQYLDCERNQLTSLDASGCTALQYLDCRGNQLTSLDVSQNTALADLSCYGNQLTSLDVSQNVALERLDCLGNQLTSLDLSMNTSLHSLLCDGNGRAVVLDELGRFDLSTLTGFEVNRAKDWTNGVLSGNMLEFQQGIVSYVYSTNNPNQAFVKFALGDYSPVAMPNMGAIQSGHREAEIVLSTTTLDATIFYTTDGREPTELSPQYEIPIEVKSSPVTIKAITVKDGKKSRVATATFSFPWLPNESALSASTLRVYAQDGTIYLSEPVGEVDVIATSGRRVYRGVSTAIPVPRPGVYVVTAAGRKYKVGVK